MSLKDDIKRSMDAVVGSMDAVRAMSELERAVDNVSGDNKFGIGELWAHVYAVERALRGKAHIFQARVSDVRAKLDRKQRS